MIIFQKQIIESKLYKHKKIIEKLMYLNDYWHKKSGHHQKFTDKQISLKNLVVQSETKAIGKELIYEAKLQNSAWPGRP